MPRRPRPWLGAVVPHKGWLLVRVKDDAGKWRFLSTHLRDEPQNYGEAERQLAALRARLQAREEATEGEGGPLTLSRWSARWMKQRKKDVRDAANDEARLRLYVLPLIGHMRLEEVRPRHLVDAVNAMKANELAPRTIRNTYSVVKALFRDARIADVLTSEDPCILTHRQLGKIRDAKPGWRATAVFTRDELVTLVSDPRVPEDRRIAYALLGIGMLRHGEMAGLRWDRIKSAEPLGRIVIDTSYDHGRTKTEVERWMAVHPTLAAMLAEWRLSGWANAFGRPPGMDDLVVPVTAEAPRKGRVKELGSMRDRHYTWKRAQKDLDALKLRRRRVHDLRRTGISLAKEDGAIEDILKRGTHAAPTHVMALYTSVEWSALCREIQKLRVSRPTRMLVDRVGRRSTEGDPNA